jgi:cyclase
MQKVTDNIFVEIDFPGCNTSIVATGDGVVVIDAPMVPADAKKWAKEAEKYGPLRYVINGEPHNDHVAGNCYFGGTVIAHEGVRQLMLNMSVEDMRNGLKSMAPDSPPLDENFYYRPPDITLSERLNLYLGDLTLQLIHMPGHTPYQVSVYIPEEKVLFASDNINVMMPFFGDSVPDKWLESLKRYQELDIEYVIPGHGEVAGKSVIGEMSALVKGWIEPIADAIAGGMSLEETLEKVPAELPGQGADMPQEGPGAFFLQRNIERIYEYLKK